MLEALGISSNIQVVDSCTSSEYGTKQLILQFTICFIILKKALEVTVICTPIRFHGRFGNLPRL